MSPTSFYLTKDGYLRKPQKADLANELKKSLTGTYPSSIPPKNELQKMIAIDFMAYAWKVPVKKQKLSTFQDLVKALWSTFTALSVTCNRIDIVFNLYKKNSIKSHERSRRSEDKGIPTTVGRLDQPLPVEMKKFWPLSSNKVSFQQIFIKWVTENQPDSRCIYLGGSHKDDVTICVRVENRNCTVERLLHCYHEEADDRIMCHVNHAVTVSNFQSVVVAPPDTGVFVCSIL